MPDLYPVTLDDMIGEVRRELEMRAVWYPKWKVNASRNKRNQMDRQQEVMEALLTYLEERRAGASAEYDRLMAPAKAKFVADMARIDAAEAEAKRKKGEQ